MITEFVPLAMHETLKALDEHEWIGVRRREDGPHAVLEISPPAEIPPASRWYFEMLDRLSSDPAVHHRKVHEMILLHRLIGRAVAQGPKIFRPSVGICTTMEHVDLCIPWGDFRWPYDGLMVEFPPEWGGRFGSRPRVAIGGFLASGLFYGEVRGGGERFAWPIAWDGFPDSVSDILAACESFEERSGLAGSDREAKLIKRVLLNLGVMLAVAGMREADGYLPGTSGGEVGGAGATDARWISWPWNLRGRSWSISTRGAGRGRSQGAGDMRAPAPTGDGDISASNPPAPDPHPDTAPSSSPRS